MRIVGGTDRYGEIAMRDAYLVQWQAEMAARCYWPYRPGDKATPWVPAHWTAWLLMHKAGLPHHMIAYLARVDDGFLRRRLAVATALMMFPPYAARIEKLMQDMPRYAAAHASGPCPAKEAPCAVPQN